MLARWATSDISRSPSGEPVVQEDRRYRSVAIGSAVERKVNPEPWEKVHIVALRLYYISKAEFAARAHLG